MLLPKLELSYWIFGSLKNIMCWVFPWSRSQNYPGGGGPLYLEKQHLHPCRRRGAERKSEGTGLAERPPFTARDSLLSITAFHSSALHQSGVKPLRVHAASGPHFLPVSCKTYWINLYTFLFNWLCVTGDPDENLEEYAFSSLHFLTNN